MESVLTRADWEDYLIRLYFGWGADYLTLASKRAYLDFNRTLHGMSALELKDALFSEAQVLIHTTFTRLQKGETFIASQNEFDDWHHSFCYQLANVYNRHGYDSFFIGQAQKWINMTFKYVFTMGETRLPGYDRFYAWCHVPLDNILLAKLCEYGFSGFSCAWSRLNDYDTYLDCQRWVREKFAFVPMDVEFKLWQGADIT